MKCSKCSAIWETNNSFKYCPFCGVFLPEENLANNLAGPAKMIKSFAERFGYEVFRDRARSASLISTFISNPKERLMLEFLLNIGAVDEIMRCGVNISDFDKERLFLKIKDSLIQDYFSDARLTEAMNWYATALIGFELKSGPPVSDRLDLKSAEIASRSGFMRAIADTSSFERLVKTQFGLELVRCVAGSFMMGSPSNELGRFKNELQHKVTITRDFFIGKFPVTQSIYKSIMGDNPSHFKCNTNPVECVIWSKALEFCEKLNKATDLARPKGYKFDLPSEAQWEYACRAGSTTALNNNKNLTAFSGNCFNLDEVAWYNKNSYVKAHPVGMKEPNAWGIYDMHGNVWEWCKDWYSEYTSTECVDPMGPSVGSLRVSRGGSWEDSPSSCRSAYRGSGRPVREFDSLGFRIALVPIF